MRFQKETNKGKYVVDVTSNGIGLYNFTKTQTIVGDEPRTINWDVTRDNLHSEINKLKKLGYTCKLSEDE